MGSEHPSNNPIGVAGDAHSQIPVEKEILIDSS